MSDRANYTTGNRGAMPQIAAIVDEIRAMGIDVKVLYASENGTTFDRREPVKPESVFPIPPDYYPSKVYETKGPRK